MSDKKKNPLFVVTNDGKDVEEAEGLWDAIIKKLNMQSVIDFFNILYELLLENVRSYAWLKAFKQRLDKVIEMFTELLTYLKILPS